MGDETVQMDAGKGKVTHPVTHVTHASSMRHRISARRIRISDARDASDAYLLLNARTRTRIRTHAH